MFCKIKVEKPAKKKQIPVIIVHNKNVQCKKWEWEWKYVLECIFAKGTALIGEKMLEDVLQILGNNLLLSGRAVEIGHGCQGNRSSCIT